MIGRRRRLGVIGALTLLLAGSVWGQGFGKNKVNYDQIVWQTIRSEHFDIYFPEGSTWMAEFTATTAEDALVQLEDHWRFQLEKRVPVIVYGSHNTFSETNVIGGLIGEGTGGFTEFNQSRVVIPFEGSYAQMRHVIHHELVHALQYNLFMSGNIRSLALTRLVSLPLWAVEGLAEFESMGWDIESDNVMRDAVISGYVPPIERMRYGVFAYKGGQSLYRYLSERYGRDKIANFLRSLKQTANVEKSLTAVYRVSMKKLNRDWRTWLKREYWPEIAERRSPGEFAEQLTDHTEDGSYLNVGAKLSPDGTRVVYVSTQRGFADVYLMDLATKKTTRIVEGEQSPDFESLFLLRPGLAWSPDGERLAIVAKKQGQNVLFLFDVAEREIEREYRFDLDAIFTPSWSPDGKRIALVGLKDGWSDLYVVQLPEGTLTRLTWDPYDERDPDWSPDGTRLVFASDRPNESLRFNDPRQFNYIDYNLFIMDVEARTLDQVTRQPARDLFPVWGPEGKTLLFVSERSGVGNLYLMRLDDRSLVPVTDSLTGFQQIDWSRDGSKVVMTAFQEGGFDVFLLGDPRNTTPGDVSPEPTRLAQQLFVKSLSAPVVQGPMPPEPSPVSTAGQPNDAKPEAHAEQKPSGLPSRFWSSIPDSLASLESSNEKSADQARDEPTDGKTPQTADAEAKAGEKAAATEESEKDVAEEPADGERRVYPIYTRPRPYRPKMIVESFGVNTQVSSFLGLSGQAYLSMSDLLGNQRLLVLTDQSISSVKNLNAIVQYAYLYHRLNYGVTAFHTRDFFLANEGRTFDRVVLVADRNIGLRGMAEYPFSQFSRLEASAGFRLIQRDRVGIQLYQYDRVGAFGEIVRQVDEERIDRKSMIPIDLAYVQDTVGYGAFGPVDGQRLRVGLSVTPGPNARFLRYATLRGDYRHYFRLTDTQNVAVRFAGGHSFGPDAQKFFLGGIQTEIRPRISRAVNQQLRADRLFFPSFEGPLRGTDLYEFTGNSFLLTNLEWRFELIRKLALGWPLPMTLRRIGGSLFADIGSAFDLSAASSHNDGANRLSSLRDLVAGVGFGGRINLGVFILRFDAAWRATRDGFARTPRYYWSLGADF